MSVTSANFLQISSSLPSNVIHANNVLNQFSSNRTHPAVFPEKLVDFFILSFSDIGNVVLDPFCGSGTTLLSVKKLGRQYIGIDKFQDYVNLFYVGCPPRIFLLYRIKF